MTAAKTARAPGVALSLAAILAACASRPKWDGAPSPPRDASAVCNGDACEAACKAHDAAACMHRASELQDRLDTALNPHITELLTAACDGGDGQGCLELAVHCSRDETELGCVKASLRVLGENERAWCLEEDAAGDCTMTGRSALFTRGYATASDACTDGVARACFLLGYGREAGYGVIHDVGLAAYWLRLGCNTGDADSCESLAVLLRRDDAPGGRDDGGADRADAHAIELRARDCDADVALACMELARRVEEGGVAVEADPERARALRKRACDLGLDDRRCR